MTKADGTRQLFDREKVVKTCLRMGASRKIADEVVEKVEKRLYDGIPTSKDPSDDVQPATQIQARNSASS